MKAAVDSKRPTRPTAGKLVQHPEDAMPPVLGVPLFDEPPADLIQN
jgi:hypothetical protein